MPRVHSGVYRPKTVGELKQALAHWPAGMLIFVMNGEADTAEDIPLFQEKDGRLEFSGFGEEYAKRDFVEALNKFSDDLPIGGLDQYFRDEDSHIFQSVREVPFGSRGAPVDAIALVFSPESWGDPFDDEYEAENPEEVEGQWDWLQEVAEVGPDNWGHWMAPRYKRYYQEYAHG